LVVKIGTHEIALRLELAGSSQLPIFDSSERCVASVPVELPDCTYATTDEGDASPKSTGKSRRENYCRNCAVEQVWNHSEKGRT